jgi:AraC-like DNA-binding protein
MGFIFEERTSDSPYIETVTQGRTEGHGSTVRPAETHWHMVLLRLAERSRLIVVGPLTTSGVVPYGAGAELLWIKLKLGTFMPHLPTRAFLDTQTILPGETRDSFWLNGTSWQFPDFDNVETFVQHLAHDDVLVRDPVVDAALQDRPLDLAERTVRHRFLRATGQTQGHIRQMQRAQQAAALLAQGTPILDVVDRLDYFDQPHLTRMLKRFTGYTPAQIARTGELAVSYKTAGTGLD